MPSLQHGFNKQTPMLFAMDRLKGVAISVVLGVALFAPMLHLIAWGGERFYLYVFAFIFGARSGARRSLELTRSPQCFK